MHPRMILSSEEGKAVIKTILGARKARYINAQTAVEMVRDVVARTVPIA